MTFENYCECSFSPSGKILTETNTNIPNDDTKPNPKGPNNVNNPLKGLNTNKCGIKDHITFKMLLNEYAQKTKLPAPLYKTETVHNTAFISTVYFNDQPYRCLATYKRQKDAEQNAAQVALTALLGFSPEGKHFVLSGPAVDGLYIQYIDKFFRFLFVW